MDRLKRVALYCRVSTGDQTNENQRRELEAVARRHKWKIVETYADKASGAGVKKRPAFEQMGKAIARREIDLVAVWSLDRLGRSLRDLLNLLEQLRSKGIELYCHQQGLDTSTPAGEAFFQMVGIFAQFERAMIVDRIKAGHARARANGVKLGRPRSNAVTEHLIREALAGGKPKGATARELGVGVGTVYRVAKLHAPALELAAKIRRIRGTPRDSG